MKDSQRTLDATILALYSSVSFPPGGAPDFDAFRGVFAPYGRLIHVRKGFALDPQVMDVETFIASFQQNLAAGLQQIGLFEREIARRLDEFGGIAHAFSTYEAFRTVNDAAPFTRGINSIQLVHAPEGWRVASVVWDDELPDNPIPAQYLPKA